MSSPFSSTCQLCIQSETYSLSLRLPQGTRSSESIVYSWHMTVVRHYSADLLARRVGYERIDVQVSADDRMYTPCHQHTIMNTTYMPRFNITPPPGSAVYNSLETDRLVD
jgi:hypothetical protein